MATERSREGLAVEESVFSQQMSAEMKTAAVPTRQVVYSQETANVPDLAPTQGKLFALAATEPRHQVFLLLTQVRP